MLKINFRGWFIIGLTAISAIVALLMGFVAFDKSQMEAFYRQGAFYFIGFTLLLWLQKTAETALEQKNDLKSWIKGHCFAIVAAFIICGLISIAISPEYRILADETNLLGTAMAMYDSHQTTNPTQVLNYYHGMQRVIESVVDMRPAFYPFMVFIAHTLLGYDAANGFVVNLFAATMILLILYALLEPRLGKPAAGLSMLALAAFPLFAMYVRSCGFETVNLLWLLILVLACDRFLRAPNAGTLELAMLTLPLLAQTRYESALSVFCVVPVLLYKLPRSEFARLGWRTVVLPFLFLPVAWLRVITYSSKAFQVESVDKAFGLDLFWANLQKAFWFFVGENRQYGMVALLGLLALAGLVKYSIDLFAEREKRSFEMPAMIFLLTAVHSLTRFAYYWGNLTLQYTSRLGLVFLPLLAFFIVYFLHFLQQRIKMRWHVCYLLILALLLHGWPVAGKNLAVRDIFYFRELKTVKQFLEREFPQKHDYYLITDLSNLYTPFRYSAIHTGFARANPEDMLAQLSRRTYSFALVIQKISASDNLPVPESRLGPEFELETIYESQLHVAEFIRISRLRPTHSKEGNAK